MSSHAVLIFICLDGLVGVQLNSNYHGNWVWVGFEIIPPGTSGPRWILIEVKQAETLVLIGIPVQDTKSDPGASGPSWILVQVKQVGTLVIIGIIWDHCASGPCWILAQVKQVEALVLIGILARDTKWDPSASGPC